MDSVPYRSWNVSTYSKYLVYPVDVSRCIAGCGGPHSCGGGWEESGGVFLSSLKLLGVMLKIFVESGTNSSCAIAGSSGHFFVAGPQEGERGYLCWNFDCID